jgi:hypothetical protein
LNINIAKDKKRDIKYSENANFKILMNYFCRLTSSLKKELVKVVN